VTRRALRRLASCVIRQPPGWASACYRRSRGPSSSTAGPTGRATPSKCCTGRYGAVPGQPSGWWAIWRLRRRSGQTGPRLTGVTALPKTYWRRCQAAANEGCVLHPRARKRRSGPGCLDEVECNEVFDDAVRPLLSRRLPSDCVHALRTHQAVDTTIPSADTIIRFRDVTDASGLELIDDVPPRRLLRRAQTPQCFRLWRCTTALQCRPHRSPAHLHMRCPLPNFCTDPSSPLSSKTP
jgi:hypothetical protein